MHTPDPEATIYRTTYQQRLAGLLSRGLHEKNVLGVGNGAGSSMLMSLVRHGVEKITLVDPDVVEVQNLCRSAYFTSDVGKKKAHALAAHMNAANPLVQATPCSTRIERYLKIFRSHLTSFDLIVAGTDSLAAQAAINKAAVEQRVPTVFIAVHEGAAGGMVTLVVPGETPCYRCVAGSRYEVLDRGGTAAVELPGAHGLPVDVGFIDNVALKVCLSVLERGNDAPHGRLFEVVRERSQVVVRCHPGYRFGDADIFDLVLSDLPTEPTDFKAELQREAWLTCDTLWLRPERDGACPDCRHLYRTEEP